MKKTRYLQILLFLFLAITGVLLLVDALSDQPLNVISFSFIGGGSMLIAAIGVLLTPYIKKSPLVEKQQYKSSVTFESGSEDEDRALSALTAALYPSLDDYFESETKSIDRIDITSRKMMKDFELYEFIVTYRDPKNPHYGNEYIFRVDYSPILNIPSVWFVRKRKKV